MEWEQEQEEGSRGAGGGGIEGGDALMGSTHQSVRAAKMDTCLVLSPSGKSLLSLLV